MKKNYLITTTAFVVILIIMSVFIQKYEKKKVHPADRYFEKKESSKKGYGIDNNKSDELSGEERNQPSSNSNDEKVEPIIMLHNGRYSVQILSYEVIEENALQIQNRYEAEDFYEGFLPDADYEMEWTDVEAMMAESEVCRWFFGEESDDVPLSERMDFYYDNIDEIEECRTRHTVSYHPETEYYFVKCIITNLQSEEDINDEYYLPYIMANSLRIYMTDHEGVSFPDFDACYFDSAVHTDGFDRKSFFMVELEPGEKKEVIVGYRMMYDSYRNKGAEDRERFDAYIGQIDQSIISEGVDPSKGLDMYPLSEIKEGND